jgi:hypothetical protein
VARKNEIPMNLRSARTESRHCRLAEHALEELSEMRNSLEGRLRTDQAITVLLYVPLDSLSGITDTPLEGGMLVDVRAAPDRSRHFAAQSAASGVSGRLLPKADFATGFRATTKEITDDAVREYRRLNPADLRRRQVAFERERHPCVAWSADDAPPLGAFIHHHPLATQPASFYHLREPAFGAVYTLTSDGDETDAVRELPLAALLAARPALDARMRVLGDRLGEMRSLHGHTGLPSYLPEGLFNLAASFLFAHHWFYPYSPLAFEAMVGLSGESRGLDDEQSREFTAALYGLHHWTPPLVVPQTPHSETSELVSVLAADLAQLGAYYTGRHFNPQAPRFLEQYVWTVLFTLMGQPAALNSRLNAVERWDGFKDTDYICLLPRSEALSCDRLCLPVFEYNQVSRLLKDRQRERVGRAIKRTLEESAPGRIDGRPRTFQTKAKCAIRSMGAGFVVACDGDAAPCNNSRWLLNETVALLAKRLQEQENR